jgi:PAS domain S-box-containing protein
VADAAAPIRVLLLEDSEIDAELVTSNLAKAWQHYRVDWVNNRADYAAALARHEHDIILADYSLPEFDGLSALNMAGAEAPHIPFIFVSGIVGEEFATNAITRGATDYVVKRNLSRLPSAIERALGEAYERAERLRAEDALRHLNATLAEQIEARTRERDRIWRLSRDLFTVAQANGRLIAVNPAWWRTLGSTEADLLSTSFLDLMHPDDISQAQVLLDTLSKGEPVEQFEARMRRRDGVYRWISWTAVPQGTEFYAVGRDVTEAKRTAEEPALANSNLTAEISERERVEATLRQMQRLEAVGQLTSGVAHDFNNLLSVILGNVGFLERAAAKQRNDPKERQHLSHIRLAAERGARLIEQLLAFSRRQLLEPRAVDLNETVTAMHDLLRSSLGGSVQFTTRLNPDVWCAMVDRTQIEMVILNLVINARDAMERGGRLVIETDNVTLEDSKRPEDPPAGDYVRLKVLDTGTGMTPEVLAKAFDPFFTTKEPGRGSGLGLAQVYGFAKQSGGGVHIETESGVGTAVHVLLPRAAARAIVDTRPDPMQKLRPQARRAVNVLLVDDDPAVRAVTATMLMDSGHKVIEADSGAAALDLLPGSDVDVLLVDYAMPGMNGAQTAAAALKLKPGLPVLFVTGYADLEALSQVREEQILKKPYRDEELRQKLDAALAI